MVYRSPAKRRHRFNIRRSFMALASLPLIAAPSMPEAANEVAPVIIPAKPVK